MTIMNKLLVGGAGLAALAASGPAAAQYYGYSGYGYNNNTTQYAAQRCAAAVQNRLSTRGGLGGILGAVFGNSNSGRVLSVTQVNPRRNTVRVRGLASSGTNNGYGPYGVGAYGALGYSYRPDLSFRCDVDYRGYVRDVDINRR
jgi:hypothetical protein